MSKKIEQKIVLSESDFVILTSGKILKKNNIEFILTDIGYNRMLEIITKNSHNWKS